MALNLSNSSNLEHVALKGLTFRTETLWTASSSHSIVRFAANLLWFVITNPEQIKQAELELHAANKPELVRRLSVRASTIFITIALYAS